MELRPFVELVRDLLAAMGQELEAARPVPEGLALRTQDGYLYVFVADPSRGSVDSVRRWTAEADVPDERLVVFSLRALPSYWGPEIVRRGGTVVAGGPFERLVRDLDIDTPLVPPEPSGGRRPSNYLPSVRQLEAEMQRAETWYSAGVLPLAARFYGAAALLKPEYVPALRGWARAQAGLGNWAEALTGWDRVLELLPQDLEGRLGRATARGGVGHRTEELRELRQLAAEFPESTEVRVALMAAWVDREDWVAARTEVEALLDRSPSDPRLRYLHAELLERTGMEPAARDEREAAARLGLAPEAAERLGLLVRGKPREPAGAVERGKGL